MTTTQLFSFLQEVKANSPDGTIVQWRAFVPIAEDQRQRVSVHSLAEPSMNIATLPNPGIARDRLIRHEELRERVRIGTRSVDVQRPMVA